MLSVASMAHWGLINMLWLQSQALRLLSCCDGKCTQFAGVNFVNLIGSPKCPRLQSLPSDPLLWKTAKRVATQTTRFFLQLIWYAFSLWFKSQLRSLELGRSSLLFCKCWSALQRRSDGLFPMASSVLRWIFPQCASAWEPVCSVICTFLVVTLYVPAV